MSWRDHVGPERFAAPWLGGDRVAAGTRSWRLREPPDEPGWWEFTAAGRTAAAVAARPAWDDVAPIDRVHGFIVGDRLVPDDASPASPRTVRVRLVPPGLDRFTRAWVARAAAGGPFVFGELEFPIGPEPDVDRALLDGRDAIADIAGVTPALDAAFRLERAARVETERRRAAVREARRLAAILEDERRAMGTAVGRRRLAETDFDGAARGALAVSGAEFVESRPGRADERVVRYRLGHRRLECTCDPSTLRIIDAGICLSAGGERGDDRFTLESLPVIVRFADEQGELHVFRSW